MRSLIMEIRPASKYSSAMGHRRTRCPGFWQNAHPSGPSRRKKDALAALASEGREGGAGRSDHDCREVNEGGALGGKDGGVLGVMEDGELSEKVER